MAIDTAAPISRRGLLVAALGGTAAAIAGVASRAERVLAAGSDGETVVVGGQYDDVRSATRFHQGDFELAVRTDGVSASYNPQLGGGSTSIASLEPGRVRTLVRPHLNEPQLESTLTASGLTTTGDVTARTVKGVGRKTGVTGGSPNGRGIRGWGKRGGHFSGKKAQVRLEPSSQATHPKTGQRGDLFVDKDGRLWFCKGNTRWKKIA